MTNKYLPLERYLLKQKTDQVAMRFDEIEFLSLTVMTRDSVILDYAKEGYLHAFGC